MNHNDAVKMMATERYLLGEMEPGAREDFEEHFFSCQECALDVKAGLAFMEQGRALVREQREQTRAEQAARLPVRDDRRDSRWADWFAWLRPAFAVPALALLLLVVGFQNLVQVPALKTSIAQLNAPEVLPSAYLASGTARGGGAPAIIAKPNQPFVLLIDIPEKSDAGYTAELYDAAGGKKLSFAVPGGVSTETLPLRIPGTGLGSGNWTLVLSGPGGNLIAKYNFELKLH